MSYNGSGVYTLPGAALANGNIVSATENNQFRNDVAAALNVAWTRDGQAPATANIPMGSHKLTGLAAGTGVGDSVRFEQLPSSTNKLDLTTSVTGTLPVANGGSGAATLTGILKGNGTSAFSAAVAGTDYLAPAAIGTTVQAYSAELQGATQGGINGMKNRIINGAMMIDQRNAGASVTVNADPVYTVDRWQGYKAGTINAFTVQQSTTAPAGFKNSVLITAGTGVTPVTTDYAGWGQKIEGLNVADFAWGTASAQPITIGFWARSSLTGTFGFGVRNGAGNRSYMGSYTINSANTFEYKTVTIAGDTTGTWATDNTTGLTANFDIGVGPSFSTSAGSWVASNSFGLTGGVKLVATTGATLYITGVQLEKGSTATSFDYRPYGTELALCQRYLPAFNAAGSTAGSIGTGGFYDTTHAALGVPFPVLTRVPPTGLSVSNAADFTVDGLTSASCSAVSFSNASTTMAGVNITYGTTTTSGSFGRMRYNVGTAQLLFTGCEL